MLHLKNKKLLRSPKFFIFLIPLIFIILFICIFSSIKQQNVEKTASPKELNYSEIYQTWSDHIDADGPEKAYSDFKTEYKSQDTQIQHEAAHVFGRLLYKKLGIELFRVCDNEFGYGCYHSFFAEAIQDQGFGSIKLLDEACKNKFPVRSLGCQHGIGHGILEYIGHEKLEQALETCNTLSWKGILYGCTSGVFMEYNLPTQTDTGKIITNRRKLNPNEPYSPCPTMAEHYKQACYYSLGQWWTEIFNKDYKKITTLCSALNTKEKQSCFLGLGSAIMVTSDYKIDPSIKTCEQIQDIKSQTQCLAGASWRFYTYYEDINLSNSVCKNLPDESQKLCIKLANPFNGP